MRSNLSIAALIILMLCVASTSYAQKTSVTPSSQSVGYAAGSTEFTVISIMEWNVSDDASWLTTTPSAPGGNGTVTATFEANTLPAPRTATLTVTALDTTLLVTVVQAAAPEELTVTPASQSVANKAGSTPFTITSNVSWTASDAVDWITLDRASGTGNATLTATFTANGASNSRTGTITVSGGALTRTVTVVQEAVDSLTVSPASRSVANTAGSTTFTLASNVSWSVTDDADWLTLNPVNGSNAATLTASYTANSNTTSRTGTITITGSGITRTVTVVQAAADYLNLSPASQAAANIAGATSFTITSNITWSVSDNADWLTLNTASGSNDAALSATFTANNDTTSRTATITVTGGGITRTATVVQAATILALSPVTRSVANSAGATTFSLTSDVTWTVSDNADWLVVTPPNGSNSATLTASFSANTNTTSRTGTITVTGNGVSRSVTVVQAPADFLTVSPSSQSVSSAAGTTSFTLSSNVSWTATDDVDWLTIVPSSGVNNATLSITYSENTITNPRTAIITVSGGSITRQVTVVQAAAAFLTIDPTSQSVANTAGNTTFAIASNTSWTVSDDADWLTTNPQTGSNNASLVATFTANPTTISRTGRITVTGGGISRTVTVIQAAAFYITVDPSNRPVTNSAGSTTFNLTSNVSWVATDNADWLSVAPASGTGDGVLTATFTANTNLISRTGTITISGGGIDRSVMVVQSAANFLTAEPASQPVANTAGITTFTLTSNVSWTVSDDADWLTLDPVSGSGGATLKATFTANSNTTPRTGTITISGGGFTRTVTVVQAAAFYLTLEPSSQSVPNTAGSTTFNISSNIDWTSTDNADWLTLDKSSGSNNATLTATFTANSITSPKTATITVTGNGITKTVTVIQAAAYYMSLSPASQPVANTAGSTTFNITGNTNWSVTDDADWLSVNPANGNGDAVLTATYTANGITEPKTATITVTGGGITKTVTVVQAAAYYLNVSPSSQSVANGEGTTTFSLTSNTSWSVTDNADWLTVSPNISNNNATLTASYSANTLPSTRTATLTITGGGITRSVTVTQAASYFLSVSPDSQLVVRGAGSTTFSIYSNTSWSASDNASWLSLSHTTGSGNATLTATFLANSVTTIRRATITITGSGITRTVKVVQEAADYLTVDPASRIVANKAGTTHFDVRANLRWFASDDADWVSLTPSGSNGNNTLFVTFTDNNSETSRTATITVAGSGITRKVTVVQSATSAQLAVTPSTLSFGADTGSAPFSVSSDVSWSVSEDASWIATTPANGVNNGTVTLTVAANPLTSARSDTVFISGGGITRSVMVTQSASSAVLTVSPTELSFTSSSSSSSFLVSSNISWGVNDNASWITTTPVNSVGNDTVSVTVAANPSTTPRTGTVTITGGEISRTVSVTQTGSPATLNVTPTALSLGSGPETTTFLITSNVNWSASDNASWITLSSTSGSNDATVTVTLSANPSSNARSGLITVSAGGIYSIITVAQAGTGAQLAVNPVSLAFAGGIGSAPVEITSNVSWTANAAASWIFISPASGPNDDIMTVSVAANPSTSSRSSTVSVTGGGITQTVRVSQSGSAIHLTVSPDSLFFGADSASIGFALSSNISWTVSDNANWISVSPVSGANDTTVTVRVAANPTFSARKGTVTVSGTGITRSLVISQSGAGAELTVSPTRLTYGANAGSNTFEITTNTSWTASADVAWISLAPASGPNDATATVTVEANPSTSSRTGTVTVVSGTETRTISVSQSGVEAVLTATPVSINFSYKATSAPLSISSNVSWNLTYSSTWLAVTPINGLRDTTVTVMASANLSTSSRIDTIKITGGGISRSIAVHQAGASNSGAILVTSNLDQATYSITGPANYTGNGKNLIIPDAPAGTYTITYGPVLLFLPPADEQLTLSPGDTIRFTREYVLSTTDYWQKISNLSIGSVYPLVVNASGHIFAGSQRDGIYRSMDNGVTWTPVNTGLTDKNISSLAINAAGHIYAGTVMNGTFRSVNNGESWSVLHNDVAALNNSSLTVNAYDHIFSSTWNGTLFRSMDNGNTWTSITNGLTTSNISALVVSPVGYIFAGTWSNGIFRSSDNGATWSPANNGFKTSARIRSIASDAGGNVYVGTMDDGIYRSTDNGTTWEAINDGIASRSIRAFVVDAKSNVFAGTDAGVFRSTDKGSNWSPFNAGLTDLNITSLAIDRGGYVLLGSTKSEFCRTIESVTHVKYENLTAPRAFSLSQNYPNPFNPITQIEYSLEIPAQTTIMIYNLLGQKIKTLVDGFVGAGNHRVTWNSVDDHGQHCPGGVYICVMISGNMRDSKKLLLVR